MDNATKARLLGPENQKLKKILLDGLSKCFAEINKTDDILDKHFSKKLIRTTKLINSVKLSREIEAAAEDFHKKSVAHKAKSYKAGFDNGWNTGYYEGLLKAAEMAKLSKATNTRAKKDESVSYSNYTR